MAAINFINKPNSSIIEIWLLAAAIQIEINEWICGLFNELMLAAI